MKFPLAALPLAAVLAAPSATTAGTCRVLIDDVSAVMARFKPLP